MYVREAIECLDKLIDDELERERREFELWLERQESEREDDHEAYGEDASTGGHGLDDVVVQEGDLRLAERQAETDAIRGLIEKREAKVVVRKYHDDIRQGALVADELRSHEVCVNSTVEDYARRIEAIAGTSGCAREIETTLYAFYGCMRESIAESERMLEDMLNEPHPVPAEEGIRFGIPVQP